MTTEQQIQYYAAQVYLKLNQFKMGKVLLLQNLEDDSLSVKVNTTGIVNGNYEVVADWDSSIDWTIEQITDDIRWTFEQSDVLAVELFNIPFFLN